jgi:hypothetical protein
VLSVARLNDRMLMCQPAAEESGVCKLPSRSETGGCNQLVEWWKKGVLTPVGTCSKCGGRGVPLCT